MRETQRRRSIEKSVLKIVPIGGEGQTSFRDIISELGSPSKKDFIIRKFNRLFLYYLLIILQTILFELNISVLLKMEITKMLKTFVNHFIGF